MYYTGSSIQACRATRRHILAFEEDKDIFDALIAPVLRTSVVEFPKTAPAAALDVEDVNEAPVVVEHVVKTSQFSK